MQAHRGRRPVRYSNFMIRRGRWKLLNASGFGRDAEEVPLKFELYDLAADASESEDLVERHPEIARSLREAYDAWFDDVTSTRPAGAPRIVVGTHHENPCVLTRQDWYGRAWGGGAAGYWELQVDRPSIFEIVVDLGSRRVDATRSLRLDLGTVTRTAEAAAGRRCVTFDEISLPAGPCRLEVTVDDPKGRRGAYQVTLRH